jgi:electron transfer flavoprotein alpha/beta subunit
VCALSLVAAEPGPNHGKTLLRTIRRWANGFAAVEVPLPALLTIAAEGFPARYAPGARIMSAYREVQIPVLGTSDLGLDPTELIPLLAFRGESFPPPLEVGEVYRGNPAQVAQEVVATLKLHGLVPMPAQGA